MQSKRLLYGAFVYLISKIEMMAKSNYFLKQEDGAKIFWGELSPCNHLVQIYEKDEIFLDMLAGFVAGGISSGESVIVAATQTHLNALNNLLESFLIKPHFLIAARRYIPLNAEDALAEFMVNNWPDEKLFHIFLERLFNRARKNNRKVRVFGEMVALLWTGGLTDATIHLERLWDEISKREGFSLFCAYPKSGFTDHMHSSMIDICNLHSLVAVSTVANEY